MLSPTCAMPISICGTAATSNCYSPLPMIGTTTSFPSAQLQQQQMPQHALHLSPCWPSPSFGELPPWMALEAANCQSTVPSFGTLFAHLPHSAHPPSVGNEANSPAFRPREESNAHLRKTPSSGENSRNKQVKANTGINSPLSSCDESAGERKSTIGKSTGGCSRRYKTPSPQLLRLRREAANARERRRMNHLNTAFDQLRKLLPSMNDGRRLSKFETLIMAQQYIDSLSVVLEAGSNTMGAKCGKKRL